MTLEMRSFGSTDSVTMTPFMFYGRRFHAKPVGLRAARMYKRFQNMDIEDPDTSVDDLIDAVVDFVASCLPPTERDECRAFILGDEIDVEIYELVALTRWLVSLGGDDADPLDKSLNGPMSNGATSEGGSTLPDYTTDPIPTS
jgi:hypothetical protein